MIRNRPTTHGRGLRLKYATLGRNVIGLGVLAAAAIAAGSPALPVSVWIP